ncbi:MAG: hypothetical protein IKB20_01280, partial [Clostridia bacterium]|nr:hypothetical protein [Clostridia bacterium]
MAQEEGKYEKAQEYFLCFLLVRLNRPKSNLFAGIPDTLKREPSESVVAIAPRANPCYHRERVVPGQSKVGFVLGHAQCYL